MTFASHNEYIRHLESNSWTGVVMQRYSETHNLLLRRCRIGKITLKAK